MGIESSIGCLKCKKSIWLGSAKPSKWDGFQVGNEIAFRFLSLHSHNLKTNCVLCYMHDANFELPPWEDEKTEKEWEEDINSIYFAYSSSSYSKEGTICGHCKKLLENKDNHQAISNFIKKNEFLSFCNQSCFEAYKTFFKRHEDISLYDSTEDEKAESLTGIVEIGCTHCKVYTIIDGKEEMDGLIKDYKYLHTFFYKHNCHENLLVFIGDEEKGIAPWKNKLTKNSWGIYKETYV